MSLMLEELLSASNYLTKVINTNVKTAMEIAKRVKEECISFVTTVARGTSSNAANFFKYICEKKSGLMVARYNHSVTTICNSKANLAKSLCLGISQSGMSNDTIMVMEMAKKAGAITVAVTNDENSPLAKLCDFHLFLNCDEEKSVAATKTFTLQIANLHMLANFLADENEPDFDSIAKEMNAFSSCLIGIKQFAEKTKNNNNLIILSRGEMLSLAEEMSLKLLETCYKFSRCYSVAEFAHGPYAIIEKGIAVIMLAPKGEFSNDFEELASRMKADGAEIIAFTNMESMINCLSNQYYKIDCSKEAEPYIFIIALQSYAAFMAESLDLNADKPRGLKKVTITT